MKQFSLANTPIYCLTYAGDDAKKVHLRNLEKVHGFNFHLIEGPASTNKLSFSETTSLTVVHTILTHLKKEVFEPFIMIENDVSVFSFKNQNFTYPDNTDAVFIGISVWSVDLSDNSAYGSQNTIKIVQSEEFPHLYHDANMLTTHGVFVASYDYAMHIADTCLQSVLTKSLVWDIPLARDKLFYNVYALGNPIFYQDTEVGGSEGTNIDFVKSTITKEEYDTLKKSKAKRFFKDY